jgi:hypothetical protein
MKYCNLLGYYHFKATKFRSLWHYQWLDIYWYGIPRTHLTGGVPTGNVIALELGEVERSGQAELIQAWRDSFPHGLLWGDDFF